MAEKVSTPEQNDLNTSAFLKTNGPQPGEFDPSAEAEQLAHGKSASEAFVIRQLSTHGKQNEWLVRQVIGLKGAHRTIVYRLDEGDERFKKIEDEAAKRFAAIDATLDVFTKIRTDWLTRKKLVRHILIGLLTLFLLPFLSLFAVEWIKRILGW